MFLRMEANADVDGAQKRRSLVPVVAKELLLLISCCSCANSVQSYGLQPTRLLCSWGLQARILEWVAMPSSRGSSQPRDQTQISSIAGRFFIAEPPGKPDKAAYPGANYI